MKRRIWGVGGALLILIGFLILLGGGGAILIDHPNQGREMGMAMLALAALFIGPGAMALGLLSLSKQGSGRGGFLE